MGTIKNGMVISKFDGSMFLAMTKQLYEWFSPTGRQSVTAFTLYSHHHIMKFSRVITIDRSDVHAKGQGHRSKVKVIEVKT